MSDSPETTKADQQAAGQTRKHVRVSVLFLAGRIISIVLNLIVQIMIVRYLTKSHFGVFAYALALVTMATTVTRFGMGTTIARFVPIYHEQKNTQKILGLLLLAFGSVAGIGLAIVIFVIGWHGIVIETLKSDPLAVSLLLILIALAPADAINTSLSSLLAAFGKARAFFFRRYILTPVLRLTAVLMVLMFQENVEMLATGYLLVGIISVAVYGPFLFHVLGEAGLTQRFTFKGLRAQAREIFSFSLFTFSSDILRMLRGPLLIVLLLEYFYASTSVADFRVILPIALLNLIVFENFAFFFVPTAARMFAQRKNHMIDELHWRNSAWVTVVSLPILLVTFSLAEPITVSLFGSEYHGSSSILPVLSVGFFCLAAFGTSDNTLRALGKEKYVAAGDFLATILALLLNVVLVSRYGPIGGAYGITTTILARILWNQVGLFAAGIRFVRFNFLKAYFLAGASVVIVSIVQKLVAPQIGRASCRERV